MNAIKVNNVYRHLKNKKLYKVIGVGRHVNTPYNFVVVYEQMYNSKLKNSKLKNSKLKNSDIDLPIGSIWVCDLESFRNSFAMHTADDDDGTCTLIDYRIAPCDSPVW